MGIFCGEVKQKPASPSCLTYATCLRVLILSVFPRLIRSMVQTILGEDLFIFSQKLNGPSGEPTHRRSDYIAYTPVVWLYSTSNEF
jgi:hypothetical protein